MGQPINRTDFSEEDYTRFRDRLGTNLKALGQLLADPDFGAGPISLGAELELYIVDADGRPLAINGDIQNALADPQLTLELNNFNLEYNFTPVNIGDRCFQATAAEALSALQKLNDCARERRAVVFPIGILPTLQPGDLGPSAMTDLPRYHALTDELKRIRRGPFRIQIAGDEEIDVEMEDVTLEGACTSFQVHLRVPAGEFAAMYNAIQLVTPLAVAAAANSPILFGRRLWHETRIPLFKKSIDSRPPDPSHPRPARVNYGHGWVRNGALELFTDAVRLYRPVIPICTEEDPFSVLRAGGTPELRELRLQMSTVWLWNRPVYDPVDNGHLRIELRSLPAGPTVIDMMANAALVIGMARLMQPAINDLLPSIPFDYCVRNFYRAAEKGLAAELIWPSTTQSEPEFQTAANILESLLPMIPEQLVSMGFVKEDIEPLVHVMRERLDNRQTGAQWQLDRFAALQKTMPAPAAVKKMQAEYQSLSLQNIPVSRW